MKREIKFLDADRNRVTVEISIDKGRFSMAGDCAGSSGQCYDSINPDGENQEKLLELWHKYHLNDMKPGTSRQIEFLKTKKEDVELWKSMRDEFVALKNVREFSDYEFTKFLLEKEGLLYDTLPDGTLYKYGTGWLTEELPENIEDLVDEVCDAIEEEEEEKRGDTIVHELDEAYELIREHHPHEDEDKIYAICFMFDTTVNELGDIDLNGTNLCYQGTDYLFGDDSEMDEEWDRDLDNYLEECIYPDLPKNMRQYFDDEKWKRDAKYDGRGHSLNRYDGGELECKVGDTWYYAYRQ